jgi:undecaprenyl-diphosphatase
MAAVIGYFWREWWRIITAGLADLRRYGPRVERWDPFARLGLWIALGTLPAVLVGLLFRDAIEDRVRAVAVVALMLLLFSFVIWFFDARGALRRRLLDVGPGTALLVGAAQAVALVPGVSRSGITIAAARGLGFERADAARFSFLLSAPAVLGAGVLEFSRVLRGDEEVLWLPLIVGAVVAAVVGALVIKGFLAFLTSHTLRVFVWYRIALGLVLLALVALGAL